MRILITTTGAAGHLGPLVPFANALIDAGDEVLVATRASTVDTVAAAGYRVWPFDDAAPQERGPIFAAANGLSADEANRRVIGEVFAGVDARAAVPGITAAAEEWRPDVVMHEAGEFAGPVVAERLGIPRVRVGISLAGSEEMMLRIAGAGLGPLRAELGLPADDDGESLRGAPYFTLSPRVLEDPRAEGPPETYRFRENPGAAPRPLPDWWPGDDRPLVYVTFGSVAGQMQFFPDLYRAAIDALAPLPIRVLATVGRECDPAELGELPDGVHVERWVPQADVMPHAAAIVCHGGFGTIRIGLTAGVPLVVLPLFADQPYNARRVHELGAGIALMDDGFRNRMQSEEGDVHGLPEAVERVLSEGSFSGVARGAAEIISTMPTVEEAPRLLRETLLTHR
jgi:UDP:flavonoid glycosyltransferase YjiC (YdhE family)